MGGQAQPFDFASLLNPSQGDQGSSLPPQNPSLPSWLGGQPQGQGQIQPQDQIPTFSTQNAPTFAPPPQGQNMTQGYQDLMNETLGFKQQLDDYKNGPKKQHLDEIQEILKKGPDQIHKQLMDQAMGITTTPAAPFVGPQQEGQPQAQNAPQQHRNWLKTILTYVGEMGLAQKQGANYVPLSERLRTQANQMYTAQSAPLARELEYESQNMRNVLTNYTRNLSIQDQIERNAERGRVDSAKLTIQQALASGRLGLEADQAAKARAELPLIQTKEDLAKFQEKYFGAKTELTQQQQKNAQLTRGLGGDAGAAMATGNLPTPQGADFMQRLLGIKAAEAPKQIQNTPQGEVNYNPRSTQMTPVIPPGAVPNTGTNIGDTKPKTVTTQVNGMPVGIPYDWSSPKETYPEAYALQSLDPRQFKDVPLGHTAENDGLFSYPAMLSKKEIDIGGQRMSPVQNSMNLLQNGEEFKKILGRIPDNQLGTIMGNLSKALAGKSDWTDPSGNVQALMNAGSTVAWSHLASQGSRSAIGAEEIANHIASLGLNRQGILNGLQAWLNQAGNVIRQPENAYEKPTVASLMEKMYPGQGYHKMLELYDPEYHKKQAQAALDRRKGGK